MSVFKHKKAISSTEFKGFEGIDTTAPHKHVPSAADMVNFRVLEDGSLEKRCGFVKIADCESEIRAVWSGKLEDTEATFIVYQNKVAKVDVDQKQLIPFGTISTTSGDTKFIFFKSKLYLMDGDSYYRLSADGMVKVEAYAPLYGKLWGVAKKGEIYEPLNLASRKIRMSYRVDERVIYLLVDHVISSIDAVFIDGEELTDKSKYYFDRSLMSVCVLGLQIGEIVDLYLTIAPEQWNLNRLSSCKQMANLGGYNESTLYFWDGNNEGDVYPSSEVNKVSLWSSSLVYGETIPLYIPADRIISTNEESKKIKALCHHYDRLLIFTDRNTWMVANVLDDTGFLSNAVMINSVHGCTSSGAAITCGNDPICVSDGSILKWTSDTDELNECNAFSISSKIESLLCPAFFKNAKILLDKKHSELYFYDPFDEDELVWIYNYKTNNWYKFDGIGADELFICDDSIGFVKNGAVYLFDKNEANDICDVGDERQVVATFESNPIDLGVYANKKRLAGMTLDASFGGDGGGSGSISADYLSDKKKLSSVTLTDDSAYPKSFMRRLNSPRFSYLTLRLKAFGSATQRIYSTGIWTKL